MASAFAVATPAFLVGESSALSSSTKQNTAGASEAGTRFNYRSYGSPALNRAIAKSMGDSAEYLPEVNMVRMRVN